MSINRRAFIRGGTLGLVSFGLDPLFLSRAAYAVGPRGVAPSRRTLVCLFQRGAVDGLSMIVPHGDAFYYQERPRIAIPREKLVDLDGHFGLHPGLAALKPFWDGGSLAAIHAVGSPDATRSHFDAQDYMESGTPGVKSTTDGWANRYCQNAREHTDSPFRAVAFGPQLPRIMAGTAPALAIDDLRTFGVGPRNAGGDKLTRAFEALYQGAATGLLASSAQESFEAIRMLQSANPAGRSAEHGAEYPRGRLGQSLAQIAQLIKAGLGMEIAFADMSGWDTHVNQGSEQGQLSLRLIELGQALAAFATDLGERMSDVCVLTMSEFGRTIRENGTGGTDHGHGTAMLALGGTVNGRRVAGHWPGLGQTERYQGRDVAVTTDFRDLFGEILTRHLGARDLASVFPGYQASEARFPGVIRA
ncbi:MAG TPA: DUF1501 domain-containing protein [Gemmatimonadales bacterium]|nr:DUF1501 domain-containing protein [Gemmatimonadales bacterium]